MAKKSTAPRTKGAKSTKVTKNAASKKEPVPFSGFAIAGFVCSFFGLLSILGIIFSAIALSETHDGKKRGRGLAIAGIIISSFVLILSLLVLFFVLIAFSTVMTGNAGAIVEQFDQGKVSVSGIEQEYTLDYAGTVELEVSGLENNVDVTTATTLSKVILSGINNVVSVCENNADVQVINEGVDNTLQVAEC